MDMSTFHEADELPVYEVVPHVGIGPVRLGMSRDEVRRIMPGPADSFLKGPYAKIETDGFLECAFQVYYHTNTATVEYVMLARHGGFVAVYRGMNVFDTKAEYLVAHISRNAQYDRTDPELGYSYIFPELDLSLWRPTMPESPDDTEGREFMTIGVGVTGYYRGSAAQEE
jgi:hypothetical protein